MRNGTASHSKSASFTPDIGNYSDEIVGCQYGRLKVIRVLGRRVYPSGGWCYVVLCKCDCGKRVEILVPNLQNGSTLSCGCFKREKLRSEKTIHGHARRCRNSRAYGAWVRMNGRCSNRNGSDYRHYGGRGITVCRRWRNNYLNFLADMGEPPLGLTLERKNNNAGYSPKNCKWATRLEQANNTRVTAAVDRRIGLKRRAVCQ